MAARRSCSRKPTNRRRHDSLKPSTAPLAVMAHLNGLRWVDATHEPTVIPSRDGRALHRRHLDDENSYWVTSKRAAEILGVNVARLNQLVAKGLPTVRGPRRRPPDVSEAAA